MPQKDNRFSAYRQDGWPLCPRCEEDELYSVVMLGYADIRQPRPTLEDCLAGGFGCYRCGWSDAR